MITIDPIEGPIGQTLEEIEAEIGELLRSRTQNPNLRVDDKDTVVGNLVSILAERELALDQAILALIALLDPDGSAGVWLDRISSLTGTYRNLASNSTVEGELIFSGAGNVADGTAFRNTDTDDIWVSISGPYISPGPGLVPAFLQAQEVGPKPAIAGTIWQLITANPALTSAGFQNPVEDAVPGLAQEGDPSLKARRKRELASRGRGPLSAIEGAVSSQFKSLVKIAAYDNPETIPTNADGIPFKAFEVVVITNPPVLGAALRQQLALAILSALGAGGESYGTEVEIVADTENQLQTVKWSYGQPVNVWVVVTLSAAGADTPISPNAAAVCKSAIVEEAAALADLGRNVFEYEFAAVINVLKKSGQVNGIGTVVVQLSTVGFLGPFGAVVVIAPRQIANIDSTRVQVTVV